MNYGDMLLHIGLIDQIDNKGFKGMENMIRKLIKQKKWGPAFKVCTRILEYIFGPKPEISKTYIIAIHDENTFEYYAINA